MSKMQPLGLGLVGAGAFGDFCMTTYSTLEGLKPVAVADLRKELADNVAQKYSAQSLGSADELINHPDVDFVHLATPPSSHHELVLKALDAGKHVLCEKPLAMTTAQADEMLTAARKADRICPVNFVLRHNQVTDAVKRILDTGALGQVLSARLQNAAADSNLGPDHWFWDKSVSGGIFIEHGVHFFDLYRYWLGDGKVVTADTEVREGTTQEDRVTCLVRHDNGALVSHYHGFDQLLAMDRTDHRMVCELGDVRVFGWIPLSLSIDAAVDDKSQKLLLDACPGAEIESVEQLQGSQESPLSRGKKRQVNRRIRLSWCPNPDKQEVYSDSVRKLMEDQLAYIGDPGHERTVGEQNGREAVALAEAADTLAN